MDLIDLRSDTVTRPTPGMRKAMAEAEVGDDVYGQDPTTNRLQDRVAQLRGKECALFVPTGTMANQLALGVLCGPGDEVICERGSHVLNYEGGAASALWGAQLFPLDGTRGLFDVRALEGALRRSDDAHYPRQRAVAIENTHNRGGGAVWPPPQMRGAGEPPRAAAVALLLGAPRLWNAHVATGTRLSDYAACADT